MKEIKQYFQKDLNAYYINENGKWRCRSVHFEDTVRFSKAREEARKLPVPVKQVICYINEFLAEIGISPILNPMMKPKEISYNERDLIWLKFSTDGFVGVIAQGNGINFQMPISTDDYNKQEKESRWQFNTSGIILHNLNKRWDTTFVLVFPLSGLESTNYSCREIKRAIGNCLIDHNVPILDYYSHNY